MFEQTDLKDRLTLVKQDGAVERQDIPALVAGSMILILDVTVPIQIEDRLLRNLPSGLVEEFIVTEPKYFAGLGGGTPAHYQIKFRRSNSPPAPASTIINNIQGENARVNIHSTDNSQNLVAGSDKPEILQAIKVALEKSTVPEQDAHAIRSAISEMENAKSQQAFKQGYQNFMASAANHMTVFAPLLGALAGLL